MWERDGAGFTDVLIGLKNDLFFREGLDDPNQVEFVWQIKFCVKSNFRPAGSIRLAIAAPDLQAPHIPDVLQAHGHDYPGKRFPEGVAFNACDAV
ncbi:hypothetical protein [Bradyrhizobium sp. dw_411]|uniref:hypothetical protein n=1 Tax=Bradyrhizobium sp. dw_411 TaxID=2720082 RepID=UPI001BCA7A55|nr:hypothetical protein [Bradyrhizobium sp. dw_411]